MARCRSCNAEVIWAVTEAGKRMPMDHLASAKGAYRLEREDDGTIVAVHDPSSHQPLYNSHFYTCPDRDKWRGNQRAAG